MKKIELQIGQLHEVELIPNNSPSKPPLCRINGMVGFIHKDTEKDIQVGEFWYVAIVEINAKYCIVKPVYISKTIDEVNTEKNTMLESFRHKKPEKKQTKKTYQFYSFQQLKTLQKQ